MEEFKTMRRFKQEISKEECIQVLREAPRGVMAFHGENDYPYAIPLNQFYDEEDKVCFTIMDSGFKKEGEWPWYIRSVLCLGRVEAVENQEKVIEQCRKLAEKFYPTKESIEKEIEKAGARVNMLCMTIDRMTGKLVKES